MDKMEIYEAELMMSQMHMCYMEDWEQTRFISYMIANNNPFRKTELPLKHIMEFSWDGESEDNVKELSEDDINRLKDRAREFELYIKNNG